MDGRGSGWCPATGMNKVEDQPDEEGANYENGQQLIGQAVFPDMLSDSEGQSSMVASHERLCYRNQCGVGNGKDNQARPFSTMQD